MIYAIIAVVLVLVAIGTAQRKKLFMLFRSTTNSLISNNTNQLSVIKVRISDIKKQLAVAKDSACNLKASELSQMRKIETLNKEITDTYAKASKDKSTSICFSRRLWFCCFFFRRSFLNFSLFWG